jgi:hypothetical protein
MVIHAVEGSLQRVPSFLSRSKADLSAMAFSPVAPVNVDESAELEQKEPSQGLLAFHESHESAKRNCTAHGGKYVSFGFALGLLFAACVALSWRTWPDAEVNSADLATQVQDKFNLFGLDTGDLHFEVPKLNLLALNFNFGTGDEEEEKEEKNSPPPKGQSFASA